jgi:hypothetical protein
MTSLLLVTLSDNLWSIVNHRLFLRFCPLVPTLQAENTFILIYVYFRLTADIERGSGGGGDGTGSGGGRG